jgi:hypothetical protein
MASESVTKELDGLLTFKLDNKAPVALDDLTVSLTAMAHFYQDYLNDSGQALPDAGIVSHHVV